ncbi:MAG: extracellular solute-binding protein [Phycisphaeraceae bacterium]|nr:extracellular solute-binding protein [Phycisphaeraceae bacterium]
MSTTGLSLGGDRTDQMMPFMQIAGGIAPDVLNVSFGQSQTYISMGLLYPLDEYVEKLAGVKIENGQRLSTKEYLAQLKLGPGWPIIEDRVPQQCWEVMRRLSRDGDGYHIYAFPVGPIVEGLTYDRLLFAEHAHQGIEMRVPRDWEEFMAWAKILTDPAKGKYGLRVSSTAPAYTFLNFLYSAGGDVVHQVQPEDAAYYRRKMNNLQTGDWVCVFDTQEAVEAAYFWARLRFEKVFRDGQFICRGVVRSAEDSSVDLYQYGMQFNFLDDRFLWGAEDQTRGFGPVPAGPTGLQRSGFSSRMVGIFAGLENDPRRRDAAWEYIRFYDGPEARRLRVQKMVQAGLGPFVRRKLLEQFNTDGQYNSIIRQISPDLERTYEIAFAGGVPAPYGKNCQYVLREMLYPLEAIWNSDEIRDAMDAGDETKAKFLISGILERATDRINIKMLGNLPPEMARQQNIISWGVIIVVLVSFTVVLRMVFKAFTPEHHQDLGSWQFRKYWKPYLIAMPALLLIAIWMYWPMFKGSVIAFQDYNVMGDSKWVGTANFSTVLYSSEFWTSLWVSILYAAMFMAFGFCTPIVLAFLLSEVPRGKVLFRTIYYLPAVLSGLVVVIMWKSFYGAEGMINQLLNGPIWLVNLLFDQDVSYFNENWLQNPHWALFFCLLPTVWAGVGPGCLIYLAALKTVPEEIYEAADIDGAGIRHKVFSIAVPTIKILVMINFIGAMIGAIRGSGGFILAMTGGGPYTETGGATEVVGLKLFYTTFGYLQFGVGAAMSWVIGAMLIGFTVFQLKRLSNVEFRTAGA